MEGSKVCTYSGFVARLATRIFNSLDYNSDVNQNHKIGQSTWSMIVNISAFYLTDIHFIAPLSGGGGGCPRPSVALAPPTALQHAAHSAV